jgi:hypothetical protein
VLGARNDTRRVPDRIGHPILSRDFCEQHAKARARGISMIWHDCTPDN